MAATLDCVRQMGRTFSVSRFNTKPASQSISGACEAWGSNGASRAIRFGGLLSKLKEREKAAKER